MISSKDALEARNISKKCGHIQSCFFISTFLVCNHIQAFCSKRFAVFVCRFAGPVDIEYRVEAEKFTGAKIVRVFFKGAPNEDDFFIERKSVLRAQNTEQCISQIVYVKVCCMIHPQLEIE